MRTTADLLSNSLSRGQVVVSEEDLTRQSAQVNEFAGDQTVTLKAADNSELTRTIDQDTEDRALIKGIVRVQDENMKANFAV